MEYSFVRTINGPMIVGHNEVIAFTQFVQLFDYHVADPEFLPKAKAFLTEVIDEYSAAIKQSLYEMVPGEEAYLSLHHYVNATTFIRRFENHFIPQHSSPTN